MAGGRPTKLTPETQKKIVDAIRLGSTYKLASQYAGITYESFNNWMNAGAAAKSGSYFQFFQAIKEAEGAAVVGWLTKIEKAASEGTWQAAAWKLERLHGEDYALTQKHRHGGDPDAPPIELRAKIVSVDPDEFNREFDTLLGLTAGDGPAVGDRDADDQS